MVYCVANNILSPLGVTTAENYQAVKSGRSALQRYEHHWGLPDAFTASLFSEEQNRQLQIAGLTRFESLAVRSMQRALSQTTLDVASPRVAFILSTTKANIEQLMQGTDSNPATAAQHIATAIGVTTQPVVVCNACISGVSAIVLAERLLEAGDYDYAIVCGADVQNVFTVSGFQSLKAVAEDDCRPFDIERLGLNFGEAAATMVLQRQPVDGAWRIARGAIRNDGYHISSPSKYGEGAYQALRAVVGQTNPKQLAFINAHGTATMFNDQMESVAIERTRLHDIPVNGYKGYFGHTLGAAGVLETILSMAAADDHTVLGTRGYSERGVSGKIKLSAAHATSQQQAFVKMISGFGGCNGALLVTKHAIEDQWAPVSYRKTHELLLTPQKLIIDGLLVCEASAEGKWLTQLYKEHIGDYPKFYKMDGLSRLGFVASELLLKSDVNELKAGRDDRAIVLCNHSSSIAADRKYLASIAFPSPSVFVYTLPNIVTGEIAIRHQYHGETSFYILPERNETLMHQLFASAFADEHTTSLLGGWLDYEDSQHFEAALWIAQREEQNNK